ncbi:hypothetical protein [Henriciella aquimarina]|uniref:hypothetical protein n=1 Tax=Henriciella aquimarina TaxID=545261 RepID=UPI000A06085A|nr:hypothetical protein [Henriciella aquimarina]
MKPFACLGLVSLLALAGCSSMNRPYISGEDGCDEIVDAKARLDCYERVDRAESDWRKEKRREDDRADPDT